MAQRTFALRAAAAPIKGALAGIGRLQRQISYKEAVPGSRNPPRSKYQARSTAEQVTSGIDLAGRNILVTGCNCGLGLETMRVLALRGAHVFGTARSYEQAEQACSSVQGQATPLVIELTQFDTIMSAVEQFKTYGIPLHGLILNAGVMQLQKLELVYALEKQFVVNHLGHFLLARELLPALAQADAVRVITLSSRAYTWAPAAGIDFDNLDGSRSYDPRSAYGQSKLANALFARELAR
ncbi:MAG: SDR family NAD(P)-dependent oxidoreductase, partial [Hyphomicrobiaceae bacterium]